MDITKSVILYLIGRLGKVEGKKKLMKLMFLVEHFNLKKEGLIKNPILGNKFYIYYYGVFSREVMDKFNSIVKDEQVKIDFPDITLSKKLEIELDNQELKEKIEFIIQRFGKESGYDLEVKTLEMLGIKPSEKDKFLGKDVKEFIIEN